jgi:uncharacterized protein (UPF0332 family)
MSDQVDSLLKKAQKYLRSAAVLFEMEDYDSTVSRAYFSMFYAAQAALLKETRALSSRQGIRSAFIDRFVKNGPLPTRAADVLERASELQEMGDYAYNFAVEQSDAEFILAESEAFVNSLANMIEKSVVG